MSFFGQDFDFDLGSANWSMLGYTSATNTLGDLTAEIRKLPVKSFCGNRTCESWRGGRTGFYYVPKLGVSVEVRATRDMVNCPYCSHALFWSRKHRLMGDGIEVMHQDHARRLAGLSPLLVGGIDEAACQAGNGIGIRVESNGCVSAGAGVGLQGCGQNDGCAEIGPSDVSCDGQQTNSDQAHDAPIQESHVAECL